jgi:hypothetical protein
VKHCVVAWLVAPPREIPSDPGVANTDDPVVGCNHLVCENCGADIKYVDGRSTTSNYAPVASDLEELYQSLRPETSPLFDSAPLHADSRTYFCRCDWYAVNLSARRRVDDIGQPWKCGGHDPALHAARNLRVAEAQEATDALIAAAVPIAVPASGAKINLRYAPGVNPSFASASELRDSLLASYPDAAKFGRAVVGKDVDRTEPAWGWAIDLIHKRSDWVPALGVALQHAVTDGGDDARVALVDLLAHFTDSIAVLPWTSPLARLWPDVRAESAGTGWGRPDFTLAAISRDQAKYVSDVKAGKAKAFLNGYGVGGKPIIGPLTDEKELRALLAESARAGQSPGGNTGPWSWLGFKLMLGDAWLRPAFVRIVQTVDADDLESVLALLDWFTDERDLWQFTALLESWVAHPPSWWGTLANTKPTNWKRTIRSSFWPGADTLGDVAVETLRRAKWQVVTPPVVDLPELHGPRSRDDR